MQSVEVVEEPHVLILIAMEAEAAPLLSKLDLPQIPLDVCEWHPFLAYSGKYKDLRVSIVTNGKSKCKEGEGEPVDNVGTTPAALATFVAINSLKPSLIINAGTAGGFRSKGAEIGDTYISTILRHHDRRITIPGWDNYAKGHHESHSCNRLANDLGYKIGIVTTGNSLDANDTDREIMKVNEASVKDMEAAAIAWVAEQATIPFFALKCVTDIVDGEHPTHEEFLANLGTAAASLQTSLINTVEYLLGKSHAVI